MNSKFGEYKNIALRALSYHDYTPKGICRRMLEKGEPPADKDTAREVVIWLHQEGFINERKYGDKLLADCEMRFLGPRRVREELKKHDFSEKYIERALSAEVDYYDRAVRFLRAESNIASRLTDPREHDRLIRQMVRNGYTYDIIKDAIEAVR